MTATAPCTSCQGRTTIVDPVGQEEEPYTCPDCGGSGKARDQIVTAPTPGTPATWTPEERKAIHEAAAREKRRAERGPGAPGMRWAEQAADLERETVRLAGLLEVAEATIRDLRAEVAAREAAAEQRGAEKALRDVIERLRGLGVEPAVVEHFTVLLAVQQNHAATARAAAVADD